MSYEVISDRINLAQSVDRMLTMKIEDHVVEMIDCNGNIDIVIRYPLNWIDLDYKNIMLSSGRINACQIFDVNTEFESAKKGLNQLVNNLVDLNQTKSKQLIK
jgi:hypothetical protein